jgi:hypothetical protein
MSGSNIGSFALEMGSTFYVSKFELKAKKENTPGSGGFFSADDGVLWLKDTSSFVSCDWTGYLTADEWKDAGVNFVRAISDAAWQLETYSVEIQPFNTGGNVGNPLIVLWDDYSAKELKGEYKAENCSVPFDSTSANKWKVESKIKIENAINPVGASIDQSADALRITVKNSASVTIFTYTADIEWVDPALFGMNVNVTLTAPANGLFYVPTETFTAEILLTNDGGDTLWLDQSEDNKVEKLEMWISGPKQNYTLLPQLWKVKIVDGYVLDTGTGFDPATNTIDITLVDTMDLEDGTFTFLIKAKRKDFGPEIEKYLLSDFQVLTETETFNFTTQWSTNCDACHGLEKHKATLVEQCVVCHTDNLESKEFVRIIHVPHAEQQVLNCLDCHVNSDGNDLVTRLACTTCHDGVITNGLPADHANYTDDVCMGCHGSGNLSPDVAHENLTEVELIESTIPETINLAQNYPNPFNPSTTIEFSLPEQADVKIVIYDALGNELEVLFSGNKSPGTYRLDWNASNYASGIYFYKMNAGTITQVKKMLLLK